MTVTSNVCLRDHLAAGQVFTITDWTEDFAMDCNTDNAAAIANCLGTLINVLIQKGVISGSVTTV